VYAIGSASGSDDGNARLESNRRQNGGVLP
jgi:hypothetical protein